MNRRNSILVKILLILFALNSFSLYLYFSHYNHNNHHHHQQLVGNRHNLSPENNHTSQQYLKPWPILPSYLPWSQQQNPRVPLGSCEAYFGNGFTRRLDVLLPRAASKGWFRCMYSETLRSSICEGGNLRMWPERIKMAKGGERIEDVFGRKEEDELPMFENGAFEVHGGGVELSLGFKRRKKERRLVDEKFLGHYVPHGGVVRHAMRELVESIRVVEGSDKEFECDQWIEEPTLLVTRYEYANLFHTITDWYSAYVTSRVTGLPHRPHLVFVDGHCQTHLEETWRALFSSVKRAKNFTGSVCFRHAILSPLGYETPLFRGLNEAIDCKGTSAQDLWQNPDNKKTARLSEFGEMIKAAFGFSVDRPHIHKPVSGHNVLFVRREDYLAHPRHKGKVESRLSNEEEVYNSLKSWTSNYLECKINIVNGLFAHMSMKEQLQAIQDASIIVGAHGAGLTHIVSAMPKTVILEIVSSQFRRPHFELIAQWKGLEYHAIYLSGSHANPPDVVDKLSNIVRNLGC